MVAECWPARFPYRYLIDHGLRGGVAIDGPAEVLRPGFLRFANPRLRAASCRPPLRVLSIDLETTPNASEIYSVALVGAGLDEVHLRARSLVEGAVVHADERDLLHAVASRIRDADPDVITGWNVVDFDLRTWAARCETLDVRCPLGRIDGGIRFERDRSFTRQTRASLPGRMVLDGIPLVRDAIRLEDYRLETAARALLGRGKLIDPEVPDAAAEISRLFREDASHRLNNYNSKILFGCKYKCFCFLHVHF